MTSTTSSSPGPALERSLRSQTVEDYLRLLLLFQAEGVDSVVSHLHRVRRVTVPTVWMTIRRMERAQLVAYQRCKGPRQSRLVLTRRGLEGARAMTRRHRLIERFLHDVLACPLSEVYGQADELEHTISERVESKIAALVGHLAVCPHGNPIDVARPGREGPERRLTTCTGGTVQITRVLESAALEGPVISWIERHGLIPGSTFDIAGTSSGHVLLGADASVLVPSAVAQVLFVNEIAPPPDGVANLPLRTVMRP